MKLSKLKRGQSGIIKGIDEKCKIRERLWDMGLVGGTKVTMLHCAPFHGPLEITLRGYRLVLRRDDADCIEIKTGIV